MADEGFDFMKSLNNLLDTVGRFIEDGVAAVSGSQALPLDIYETEEAIVVKAGPLAGIEPEGIDVSITADTLTIKGETRPDDHVAPEQYIRRERKFGPFSRSVKIPRPVHADQTVADFRDGILIITMPKVESTDPKVINVRTVNP